LCGEIADWAKTFGRELYVITYDKSQYQAALSVFLLVVEQGMNISVFV